MTTAKSVLPDFNQEMAMTRQFLERVPMDRADFKPHARSMSLGALANHLIAVTGLGLLVLQTEGFNLRDAPRPALIADSSALLAQFDERVAALRAALDQASDEALATPWRLAAGEHVMLEQPRSDVLRWVLNHIIHHRAQLGVYLRMLDLPVPGAYGPSSDER